MIGPELSISKLSPMTWPIGSTDSTWQKETRASETNAHGAGRGESSPGKTVEGAGFIRAEEETGGGEREQPGGIGRGHGGGILYTADDADDDMVGERPYSAQ